MNVPGSVEAGTGSAVVLLENRQARSVLQVQTWKQLETPGSFWVLWVLMMVFWVFKRWRQTAADVRED